MESYNLRMRPGGDRARWLVRLAAAPDMRRSVAQLVAGLRRGGLQVSVAESIDAARAAAVVSVDRDALRDALAAALVKDERDRPLLEREFDRVFPAGAGAERQGRRRRHPRAKGGEVAGGAGERGGRGATGSAPSPERLGSPAAAAEARTLIPDGARAGASGSAEAELRPAVTAGARRGGDAERDRRERSSSLDVAELANGDGGRLARRLRERSLMAMPFREMSTRDVEEAADLVRSLAVRFRARLRRRLRPRARGRLDFRRTIRAAIPSGGTPFRRFFRGRRPGKLDLLALCDLSGSAATATDFFLTLLAPATDYFAHVRLFGFVDQLVEIEFVDGQVRPAGKLDLMARSDFGRVLGGLMAGPGVEITASSVLLVLGDARNNRRPPRADLLAAARARVRSVLWLNPEPEARWNTGDSVIGLYARHVDAVVPCGSLAELDRALIAVARL